MLYGYKMKKSQQQKVVSLNHIGFKIQVFHLFKDGFFLPYEILSMKEFIFRILLSVITYGKAKIYYLQDGNERVIHTSYCIPACFKFPFLSSSDFEIGPCRTHEEMRGMGIYPWMLQYIVKTEGTHNSCFYMIVDDNNISSTRGVIKAGFSLCGRVKKSTFTKVYYFMNNKEA